MAEQIAPIMRFLFVGPAGNGKTYFIKKLCPVNDDNIPSEDKRDGTKSVYRYDYKNVVLIDTPGLGKSRSIVRFLNLLQNEEVSEIFFVYSSIGKRVEQTSDLDGLENIVEMFSFQFPTLKINMFWSISDKIQDSWKEYIVEKFGIPPENQFTEKALKKYINQPQIKEPIILRTYESLLVDYQGLVQQINDKEGKILELNTVCNDLTIEQDRLRGEMNGINLEKAKIEGMIAQLNTQTETLRAEIRAKESDSRIISERLSGMTRMMSELIEQGGQIIQRLRESMPSTTLVGSTAVPVVGTITGPFATSYISKSFDRIRDMEIFLNQQQDELRRRSIGQ